MQETILLFGSAPIGNRLLLQVLNAACEACQKSIEGAKGKMSVKEAARAVSERDDRLLAEKMEALEAANREVRS
jgi:translation initiation factor 2 subunit 1